RWGYSVVESMRGNVTKYRLVAFDMDGVLLHGGTWRDICRTLGMSREEKRLQGLFESGHFPSAMEWSEAVISRFAAKGLTSRRYYNVIGSARITPGAISVFEKLRENGIKTAIISGGFKEAADRLKAELKPDYVMVHCSLKFSKSGKLDSFDLSRTDFEAKAGCLRRIAKANGIPLEECAFVGDGRNDLRVMGLAGFSIAFNTEHDEVREAADVAVDSGSLTAVLPYIIKR
ncbi:MAG: HAD-IB family phosphatase, partial [Candidatus Micrarchaeota archaeon]|nr:HAD-IB family phosphatase [Candidatus Micrarchaeota archaeon]